MSYAIRIKPLSVNECYTGRRFATKKLKAYKKELGYKLPNIKVPFEKISLKLTIGLSNPHADLDNIAKAFCDVLQARYGFNDHQIYWLEMDKVITDKGAEFIQFTLAEYISN